MQTTVKLLISVVVVATIACVPPTTARAQPSYDTADQANHDEAGPYAANSRGVRINNRTYDADQLRRLGITGQIQPGNYWYDQRSGAWGYVGTGTRGFTRPGLPLGAMKTPTTGTRVFINGREITYQEAVALHGLLGGLMPGRYFVNANGDAGFEGGPVRVNLIQLAVAAMQRQGSQSIYSNGTFSQGGCAGGYCSFQSKITGKHLSWPN